MACGWCGGFWFCGNTLPLVVLGNDFAESGAILTILSPILLLKSLNFALAAVLVPGACQQPRTIAQALPALSNVGPNILIVSRYGVVGVACVYVLRETFPLVGHAILGWGW